MCGQILNDRIIKARKDYRCNAFDIIHMDFSETDLNELFSEYDDNLKYKDAQKDNFMIRKGDMYRRYTWVDQGDIIELKESLAGSGLAQKYNLYQEC